MGNLNLFRGDFSKELQIGTAVNADLHFEGKLPVLKAICDQLLRALAQVGPVQQSSKKGRYIWIV